MKHAFVTGSTRGIGSAVAEKLIQNGYHVFINGRYKCPEISLTQDCYTYIQADMSTLKGVNKFAKAVLAETQKLDCIVLNTGVTCRNSFRNIEYSDWQCVMDTNVNMPFFIIKEFHDFIVGGGVIVFISSILSIKPHAASIPYGVSKAAVNMLAQSLVKEFAPRGIRVNVVCPGFIDTEWQKEKPEALRTKIEDKIALNRFGTPREVADICFSLVENTYMNGAVVSLDGGYDFV